MFTITDRYRGTLLELFDTLDEAEHWAAHDTTWATKSIRDVNDTEICYYHVDPGPLKGRPPCMRCVPQEPYNKFFPHAVPVSPNREPESQSSGPGLTE